MSIKTAGQKAAKARPALEMSLAEFGEYVDGVLHERVDLAGHVQRYRTDSDMAAALGSDGELRGRLRQRLAALVFPGGISDRRTLRDGRVLAAVTVPAVTRTVTPSAAVKKTYPTLWAAARVPQRTVVVRIDQPDPWTVDAIADVDRLVSAVRGADDAVMVSERLAGMAREARRSVGESRLALLSIFERLGPLWSGDPHDTTDGYTVGFRDSLRFSAPRCRELADARGVDLSAVEAVSVTPARVAYKVTKPGAAVVDLDGGERDEDGGE